MAGYVNAYTGISQRPNAQLVFNADTPLGQHGLKLRLVVDLGADREIRIAYGARHVFKDKKRSGPKQKQIKEESHRRRPWRARWQWVGK